MFKMSTFEDSKSEPMLDSQLDEDTVSHFSPQQVITYFNLYLKNANIIIESMARDFQNNDIEAIRSRAHKLKGSSMVVGATKMKELAAEIEKNAKENGKADAEKFEHLKEQFSQLVNLLKSRYNINFAQS